MLTRENEESVIDESISVNPDQREVDDSLTMARREKLSKYDNKNYEEDIQRRSLITQREQQAFERTNLARQSGRYCGSKWYPAARPLVWNSLLANAALGHVRMDVLFQPVSEILATDTAMLVRIFLRKIILILQSNAG
jgi:hypothetical protein